MATETDLRDAIRSYADGLMDSRPGSDYRFMGASLYGVLNQLEAAEARVADLEAAIKEARHYLGLAKCGDPNCGGCRHDYEQAWDVLHAALKGQGND